MNTPLIASLLAVSLSSALLAGCASSGTAQDPYESFNRAAYGVNDAVDKALVKPITQVYVKATLPIVRQAVDNVLGNLNEIPIIANDLVQLRFESALESASRFAFNSTFGVLGLINLTKPFNLPESHANDVGMTLAYYGWKESHFLVIPFLGPATVRDGIGRIGDIMIAPLRYSNWVRLKNVETGLRLVNVRSKLLELEKQTSSSTFDPYIFQRETYVQFRNNQLVKAGMHEAQQDKTPSVQDILKESGE